MTPVPPGSRRSIGKETVIGCFVTVMSIVIAGCSSNPSSERRRELQGRWTEVYVCHNLSCDYPDDTLHVSVITFNYKTFSTEFYNDTGQFMELDTTFSGTFTLSKDTIELVLRNFREVFYYRIADPYLYLTAAYSIDSEGNTLIDFRSVLWCCDKKKSGRFEQ